MKCIFNRCSDRLVELASNPGWFDYAKARAQELDVEPSGLFRGIYQVVNQRIKDGQATQRAFENQNPVKSR